MSWRQRLWVLLGLSAFVLLGAVSGRAFAAGVACVQDCSSGSCRQVGCDKAAGNGSCQCGSGALPFGSSTFGSWCLAWEPLHPSCTAPADPAGTAQAPQIAETAAMMAAAQASNPYLALLLRALQDGQNWATGAVHGFLHESQYDESTGVLSHTPALAFTGTVLPSGSDAVQIDLAVAGDIRQLAHIQQSVAAMAPAAVPPLLVHGTVTNGGSHGSLLVTGAAGSSQTVQW